jgi:hypothetical protein
LLLVVPAFAVKSAFGKCGAAFGFLLSNLFRVDLTVFAINASPQKEVFADDNEIFKNSGQ